jgi:hypothetical protein
MSSDRQANSEESEPVSDQQLIEGRSGTVGAVLQVRGGMGTPLEGTVEVGSDGPRSFHGWLELMGLVEEAKSTTEP